jgi:hypothetical protein
MTVEALRRVLRGLRRGAIERGRGGASAAGRASRAARREVLGRAAFGGCDLMVWGTFRLRPSGCFWSLGRVTCGSSRLGHESRPGELDFLRGLYPDGPPAIREPGSVSPGVVTSCVATSRHIRPSTTSRHTGPCGAKCARCAHFYAPECRRRSNRLMGALAVPLERLAQPPMNAGTEASQLATGQARVGPASHGSGDGSSPARSRCSRAGRAWHVGVAQARGG